MLKTIAAAIMGILLITGCESADPLTEREAFLQVVREQAPELNDSASDKELVAMATAVCNGFEAGLTFEDVVLASLSGTEGRVSPEALGAVIGAGTAWKCPEYLSKFDTNTNL